MTFEEFLNEENLRLHQELKTLEAQLALTQRRIEIGEESLNNIREAKKLISRFLEATKPVPDALIGKPGEPIYHGPIKPPPRLPLNHAEELRRAKNKPE